jgi:hypothetical protein
MWGFNVGITDGGDLSRNYFHGLRWHDYVPSFMMIGSVMQVISSLLPQQFESL